MARASQMRTIMHNNTNFTAISLDNLDTVTGGYLDQVGPTPPDAPQSTLVSHVAAILNRFADLASKPAS